MRRALPSSILVVLVVAPAGAQSIAGDSAITLFDTFGPTVSRLSISLNGEAIRGSLAGRPIEPATRCARGTLNRLRLNRGWAQSGSRIVGRAQVSVAAKVPKSALAPLKEK